MLDGVWIVLISLSSTLLSEGLSWLTIYRTERYKQMKKAIDALQAKVDKKKAETPSAGASSGASSGGEGAKTAKKKLGALDEQLKARQRDLSMSRMKSTFFVGIILLSVFGLLNHLFDGLVVAKLPFEPFSLIRGFTHRGLPGSDYTDCSFMFLYILSSMSIRAHVVKFLGFTPANAGSFWQPPDMSASK